MLALTLFTVTIVTAQTKTPEERAAAMTAWMKTNLQLTADQETTVKAINLKYAKLNEPLKTSTESRMQKMRILRENDMAKEKELTAVLNADQLRLYDSKKAEMKEKFKEEMQQRKGQ